MHGLSRRSKKKTNARLERAAVNSPNERTEERVRHADALLRRLESTASLSNGADQKASSSEALAGLGSAFAARCNLGLQRDGRLAPDWEEHQPGAARTAGCGEEGGDAHVPLKDLLAYTRLKPGVGYGWMLLLALYAPLGVLILAVRAVITVCAGLMLACLQHLLTPSAADRASTFILRAVSCLWGLWVRLHGNVETLRAARLIAANHVTQVDGLPLRLFTPLATLMRETYRSSSLITRIVTAAFAPIYVPTPRAHRDSEAQAGLARVQQTVHAHLMESSGKPVLVFPEGSITNGRSGLMRFHRFIFGLGVQVQPVAIRVWAPLPLEADTVWDSLARNILFTLFQPFTRFEIVVLPPLTALDTEDATAFASRVARSISLELNLPATQWATKDKTVHLQRVKAMGKRAWLHEHTRASAR